MKFLTKGISGEVRLKIGNGLEVQAMKYFFSFSTICAANRMEIIALSLSTSCYSTFNLQELHVVFRVVSSLPFLSVFRLYNEQKFHLSHGNSTIPSTGGVNCVLGKR